MLEGEVVVDVAAGVEGEPRPEEQPRGAPVGGGRSGEHEVSVRSARSVIEAFDVERYEVVPIAITREGRWLSPAARE